MRPTTLEPLPIAVIGGGPVGLAAAAHVIARNLPVRLYEAGAAVGANLRDWGHVRVFTPWRYCVDAAAAGHVPGGGVGAVGRWPAEATANQAHRRIDIPDLSQAKAIGHVVPSVHGRTNLVSAA